jgi:hypothetical protein
MSDTPEFMTHERIMTGEEYVSYSDYLSLQRERDKASQQYDNLAAEHMLAVNKFAEERDEARAVADELASVAAHCLGWHEHESSDAAIKIAAALKRWKKSK